MKKLFLLLLTVATIAIASAQTRTVTGQVVYAGDGEPLVGVSVIPVGSSSGTTTDVNGEFSLKVSNNVKKLRFTYIGMHAVEAAITGEKMLIKMQNADTSLDEVMVVAYGTAKRSAFTGSAAVIDASDIENSQVSNALNVLSGKVAGIQINNTSGAPGSSPSSIRIRGISSLNAGNSPLVVVDGAPFGGDVSLINSNDIQSMTVLKDAAANALYGTRGANGVILITTKKGQGGGATVTFDAKWGANRRATQDYNTINDPNLYYETYYKSLYNYYLNQNGATPASAWASANSNLIDGSFGLGYNIYSYPAGEMLIGANGKLNPNATIGRMVNYKGTDYWIQPDNWLDETYEGAMRQEYNFSVSNNAENSSFYASAGYLKNEGIIPNSDFERITGRLAADTQAKSWLKVGGNFAYTHYETNSMAGDGSGTSTVNPLAFATSIAPIYPMYLRDAQRQYMRNADGLIIYDYGDGMNAGLNRPAISGANGLSSAIYNTSNTEGNSFNVNGFMDITFLKDFKFTTNNTVYIDEYRGTSVTNPLFGQGQATGGSVTKSHNRYMNYQFQQLLTWAKNFDKHNVNILLGHENSWIKAYYLNGYKTQMFSPDNKELNGAVVDGGQESYTTDYNNEGYLMRAQYDYDSRYFGSFSFRRDASSRFHPSNRWGNFWSLGGAWIISKEEWYDLQWMNMLKFKASYGEQGNDNIGNYRYTNTYSIVNSDGKPAVVPSSVMGNTNLTWEKNGNFNIGVEFGMFNDRLTGSFEGFYRKTTDMLYQKPLPVSMGYTNQWQNFGDMKNAGIETELNGILLQGRDFSWDVNFNLTWYKNEVTRLPETSRSKTVEGYEGTASGGNFIAEGLPLYTYYCYEYAGVDQVTGRALYYTDVKEDGKIVRRARVDASGKPASDEPEGYKGASPERYLCGSALPEVYGGFGTSATYKGFDISFAFNYQLGGQVMDGNYQSLMSSPGTMNRGNAMHADILKSWTAEAPNNTIPRLCFSDQDNVTSSRFLTSASYLSLQNINFGYTLPQSIVNRLQLQKLRVYLSCENVWLWSKRQGLDPRQSISGSSTNVYYSPIRTISGGFTVTL